MPNVPKIVLKRLEMPVVESHPDADLLTAFVEHSLAESERGIILDHLSVCGDCREVVALALPASEDGTVATRSRPVRSWFTVPVFRWGVVGVGILAVASVGVLQYRQRQHEGEKEKQQVASSRVPSDTPRERATGATLQRPVSAAQTSVSPPSLAAAEKKAQAGEQPAMRKPAARALLLQNNLRAPEAVPAPRPMPHASSIVVPGTSGAGSALASVQHAEVPAASEAAEVEGAAAAESATTAPSESREKLAQNQLAQNQLAQNQVDLPLRNRAGSNLDVVGKAKDPVPAIQPPGVPSQMLAPLMKSAAPLWTITPTGSLQRSLDGGRTWEDVNVNSASLPAAAAMSAAKEFQRGDLDRAELEGRAEKGKKNQPTKSATTSTVLRALAANGSEVWVGGSAATLYHTLDAGVRWTRVLPSSAGVILTGDIITVQFSDPQHGTITTSTPEVWTTADDGQTWQKIP
jgi:hypothetical protein